MVIVNRQSLEGEQYGEIVQLATRSPRPQIFGIVPDEHAYQQQQQQQQQCQDQHPHCPQPHQQQQGATVFVEQHWKYREALGTKETVQNLPSGPSYVVSIEPPSYTEIMNQ